MYSVIKRGSTGDDVKLLCSLLGIQQRDTFNDDVEKAVLSFQQSNDLGADGIVGYNTWKQLIITAKRREDGQVTDEVYSDFASLLGIEKAALKAVTTVETGGRKGFLSNGKPPILFEGHIFWSELRKAGKDPARYTRGNEDVLYKSWSSAKYKGGVKEYERLEKAKKIDEDCALKSASWGLFQIMGNNYKTCGCDSVDEFVKLMCASEYDQFVLGVEFIKRSGLVPYLKKRDWAGFALRYNGSGYKKNKYDTKLKQAYERYSH